MASVREEGVMRLHGFCSHWTALTVVVLIPLVATKVLSARPDSPPGGEKIFDTTTRADVNELDMALTNSDRSPTT